MPNDKWHDIDRVGAAIQGTVVGSVRSSDLSAGWLVLDQISVDPAYAQRGIGRRLLVALADRARELGYLTITGTTFRAVPFNAPFYADLDAAEEFDTPPGDGRAAPGRAGTRPR